MPARSKIDQLPADTVARIKAWLAEQNRSVDDFLEFLTDEIGLEIGRSSAHRFQQSFEKVAENMRRSQQMADALCAQVGPSMAESKTGRMLTGILQNLVFDHLMEKAESGETGTPMDMMLLAKTIKDTVATLKLTADQERQIRDEMAKEVTERLDNAVAEASAAGEDGLSSDRIAQLRRDFLGVKGEA